MVVTTAPSTSTRREAKVAGPSPVPTRRRRRPARGRTIILAVVAYAVAAVFLMPYIQMILTSVRAPGDFSTRSYWPTSWDWSTYTTIWASGFGENLGVSITVAAGATVLVLLVALPAAYYTARHNFRGRGLFLLLVLVTQMLQPAALIVGIYREFLTLRLLDNILSLVLVNAGFNLAFAVWILNAYFRSIPVELEEAAAVDGASRIGVLRRITIPLAMPGIVTATIFTFIAAWNEFLVALTLISSADKQPMTVALNSYIGKYQVDWSHLFAGAVIATVPVIILFALIEGKVVGGLTAGAVK